MNIVPHRLAHGDVSGPLLPDTAQSAAWRPEASGHLVVAVGDNLNLHQVLQAVVQYLQVTVSLSPGRLGCLHRPECDRNLQNTKKFKQNMADTSIRFQREQMVLPGSVSPSVVSRSAWPPVLRCDWSDQGSAPPLR